MKFAENVYLGPSMLFQRVSTDRDNFWGVLETAERSCQVLVAQWSLNGLASVERGHYKATYGNVREIEWGVAISWQLRGLRDFVTGLYVARTGRLSRASRNSHVNHVMTK